MAWWNDTLARDVKSGARRTELSLRRERALTAAAINVSAVRNGRRPMTPASTPWQQELWDYYDNLGEFWICVAWRAYMISRVRLRAARLLPGEDEPEIIDNGPPADLMNVFAGGTAGQVSFMRKFSVLLDVPAEGWLVGNQIGGRSVWRAYSGDEIRRVGRGNYEIIADASYDGNVIWEQLDPNAIVTRVWRPSDRLHYVARSPALASRSAMRELELVNRHIQAQYLSRLASAGVVLFPEEMTFPVRQEFEDAPDPFVREWIETAAEAIKTPGSASAVIPLPLRVPAEYVDKVKHVDFTLKLDDRIIEKRDSARRRLASQINAPAELLFDASNMNHWGLWQIEEGAVRTYIAPDAEIICDGVTRGYLQPMLKAAGVENADEIVCWYDASELIIRADKSEKAVQAYDRLELSGTALRRESGFDEGDKPTDDELAELILRKLTTQPQLAVAALQKLTGVALETAESDAEPPVAGGPDGNPAEDDEEDSEPENGAPGTRDNAPPEPGSDNVAARLLTPGDPFTILQAKSRHVITLSIDGWQLKHPLLCQPKQFSCPFTHATWDGIKIHPGTYGDYACWLDGEGKFIISERIFVSPDQLIANPRREVNGANLRATTA
jgi:hypothetical protein